MTRGKPHPAGLPQRRHAGRRRFRPIPPPQAARAKDITWTAFASGAAPPQRHDPDLGRQERGPAADDREPLTDETLELVNVPRLADISALLRILSNFGVDHLIAGKRPGQTTETGQTIRLSARTIIDTTAPYELVSTMRASFWVVAPMVARLGEARSRCRAAAPSARVRGPSHHGAGAPGAEIEIDGGYVIAKARRASRAPRSTSRR
jgi:UDP-N-acetylglucosamine 1-carboxyvinyltransferase